MMRRGRSVVAGSATLIAASALCWAAGVQSRLYVNGKVASTDVITKDGKAYVPVKDVAAALGMTVVARGDGFELARPGGAGQVQGLNGKIGDDMFNGSFRFTVVKLVRGDSYKRQFSTGDAIPAPNGEEIVAVVVRLKNGTTKAQFPHLVGTELTALTDDASHSFEVYDGGYSDVPGRNYEILPGAAVDFALTFHVPKGTELKDLVYKVDCIGVNPNPPFRVSLKE